MTDKKTNKKEEIEEKLELVTQKLQEYGLQEKQAKDTARNLALANQFIEFIQPNSTSISDLPSNNFNNLEIDKSKATLLLRWATGVVSKLKDKSIQRKHFAANQIKIGNLASPAQVDAALEYLSTGDGDVDEETFKKKCGVGFSITKEEVKTIVVNYVKNSTKAQETKWASLGKTTGELKKLESLRWSNPMDLKTSVDETFLELFGPKDSHASNNSSKSVTNASTVQKSSTDVSQQSAPKSAKDTPSLNDTPSIFDVGMLSQLHKPGENPQKDPQLVLDHLKATGGKVLTRFPPEPNGFLHIGHSKAIAINFGFAAHHGGNCVLRYDDTNPEAEEQIYIDSILDIIRWLGFEPHRITYSSDYFDQLYNLAEQLILIDKAYVCFCTAAEIKENRGGEQRGPRKACVHRTLPVEKSLEEFRKMRDGDYQPNQIILRMKQDLDDGNPQMWDLVAYRVLNTPHHRTGSRWRIYPTYDFTHCLVDSLENITHSLCTTEFIQSRVSYEWLCHALNVYTPRQTEYGRLNLEGTVMSKRKIMKLVKEGHVQGWDDPRLYTLIGLRRRGVPPEAILKFVNSLGVATAVSNIEIHRFDQSVRQYLELATPRLMMILKPIKVIIENLPADFIEILERPVHPKVPEMGSIRVPFTRVIYIERDDFSLIDSEDFFRLTPTRSVGLFQVNYPIKCKSWTTDPTSGQVTELICTYENDKPVTKANKPKAYIHWIAHSHKFASPVLVNQTRIYKTLFNSPNPAALDDFLKDVNDDSLEIIEGSMIETGFWQVCERILKDAHIKKNKNVQAQIDSDPIKSSRGLENVRFQGMRTAYFTLDKDSLLIQNSNLSDPDTVDRLFDHHANSHQLIFNRIVSLKEDSGKQRS